MAKNTLLILTQEQELFASELEALDLRDLEICAPRTDADIEAALGRATIVFGSPEIAQRYVPRMPALRWMQSTFAGNDALLQEGMPRNYMLTSVRDVYGQPMAEYVFAYVLAFKKQLLENVEFQKIASWRRRSLGELSGETLGIVGAGSIGKEIARIGKAFGMHVLGYRTARADVEHFDEIFAGDELRTMLARGDYVVSVLPKTAATDDLFDASAFAAMKPGSIFINIGRGNAVDEDALVAAVASGHIGKAVLDVFKEEPLSTDNPLWKTPNIYVTPHMSGYLERSGSIVNIFADNYRRFIAGEPLMYQVSFEKGY